MFKYIALLFAAAVPFLIKADIVVRQKLPRSSYMRYEPVIAEITLRNNFGQVLIFGKEMEFKGHLEAQLTDINGRPLPDSGAKINLQGLILRPGVDQMIRVNVGKWLNIRKSGFYTLKFYLSHPMLKSEYQSNAVNFDVSQGKVIWSKSFGVPRLLDDKIGGKLPVRTYTVRGLQDKDDVKIFLFVEDKDNIYSIKNIGTLLGNSSPQCNIDSLNQLHILHQIGNKVFLYYVFDWNGKCDTVKSYRTTDTIPVLFRNPASGEVKVVGGALETLPPGYSTERLLPANAVNSDKK